MNDERYAGVMLCPACGGVEDKVVETRAAADGSSIRRRRECATCGCRSTTFERIEGLNVFVIKSDGRRVPFDKTKVETGVLSAAKGRPVSLAQIEDLAASVEAQMAAEGHEVSSQQVGLAVLDRLRVLDEVAYLRFVSVYKSFATATDFQDELGELSRTPLVHAPEMAAVSEP